MRREHLRTGVIKGHQQTAMPLLHRRHVLFQVELMMVNALQRFERNRAKGDNHCWIEQRHGTREKIRTLCPFCFAGFAICSCLSSRIAECGTGEKNFLARPGRNRQKTVEVFPLLVPRKGNASPIGAFSAWRLTNEEYSRVQRAIKLAQHCAALTHRWAASTNRRLSHKQRIV